MPAMLITKQTFALVRGSSTNRISFQTSSNGLAMSCGMLARQFALVIHTHVRSSRCGPGNAIRAEREVPSHPTAPLMNPAAQDQEGT